MAILSSGDLAHATIVGPDAFGYTAQNIVGSFEDISNTTLTGSTAALNGEDDAGVTAPIGFNFNFYGRTFSNVSVTPNGLATFGGVDTDSFHASLTANGPVGNLASIAVLWHDWAFDLVGSDQAYYVTVGTPGSRKMIIQWNQAVSVSGAGLDSVTFQAKLFEGSNNIEFHYLDVTVSDDLTISKGADSTVGIRDVTGQFSGKNLQWSFDQAILTDGSAIRFEAPIPEPSSLALLACGSALLLGRSPRRHVSKRLPPIPKSHPL